MGSIPPIAYVTTSSLILLNAAIVITAPSSMGFRGSVASLSATAKVMAVPRDCPTRAIREGDMPAPLMAQLTAARPSVIKPSSEGEPVERP